jgi:preprotein translocase subunit SecE
MPKVGSSPMTFLREVKAELLKVTWPTKNQTIRLTVTVIFISAVVGIFVGSLDLLFTTIMNLLLKR